MRFEAHLFNPLSFELLPHRADFVLLPVDTDEWGFCAFVVPSFVQNQGSSVGTRLDILRLLE